MSGCRLMRAIRVREFGAPSVLRLCSDVTVPQPGDRQVLIRVHACGVNPVETYIRAGTYARKPPLPYTPGTDVAGVVESVGEGVTAIKAGDRVFTTATESGGYAEFTVAADTCVHKLPDALDFTQGAAIGIPYFTAYRALIHKAHTKAGETVLVHGASGGVGVAACQLSRALGFKVLGTAGTPEGMKLALNNGAHQAFNHREEGYTDKIMEATGGRGVDVIAEMLSNVNLSKDLQMLAYGGRVTVIGCRGSIEINPRDTMAKESSIMGVALFFATPLDLNRNWPDGVLGQKLCSFGLHQGKILYPGYLGLNVVQPEKEEEENEECAALLYAGMEAGWLRPVVGSQYPLDKAAQAHHDIIECPGAAGKTVLTM